MNVTLSNELVMRSPTMNDLDDVLALRNACAIADTGAANLTAARLRTEWTDTAFDLAGDAWLVAARDGRLVGCAEFYEEDPPLPYEMLCAVHPDSLGRGIGTHLLHRIEQRAQQAIAQAPPGARVGLQTGVYATNESARQLLEREGYTAVRRWQRKGIEMDAAPPAPRVPDGILVRVFDMGREDRAVHAAYEEAMADEWGHPPLTYAEWRHFKIDGEDNFDPTLWFLAIDGSEIAGLAICRWERPGEPDEGHVRDLGVRPAWRRRGMALALLQHVFAEFYRRGKRKVGLGVDATSRTGADLLYAKAGMRVISEMVFYEKELRAGRRATNTP
jgi:mycothiol synthase